MKHAEFIKLAGGGWLGRYLAAMEGMDNEMPLPFHLLSAMVVMGQLVGLRSWAMLDKSIEVFPNVNSLLLSPAGRCRRGEGTKMAIRVGRYAGVNVFEGKVTPEGLADELYQRASCLLYVEELSVLFSKKDYQRPIIPFLTKALLTGRAQFEERTRTGGARKTLRDINLSMLGTTAPDWFFDAMPEEAYGGGLMSRYLVCYLTDREVVHVDIDADGSYDDVLIKLGQELRAVTDALPAGKMRATPAAQRWFNEFYHANETREIADVRMEPHRNRKPANLMRVALILACSDGATGIEVGTLERAEALLAYLDPTLVAMWEHTDVAGNEVGRAEQRVVRVMRQRGGRIGHGAMMRELGKSVGAARSLRSVLEDMEQKGLIGRGCGVGEQRTWPPSGWAVKDIGDDT